jgi:hypothetical protein
VFAVGAARSIWAVLVITAQLGRHGLADCQQVSIWNFLYLFYHDFAKIYGPAQILQKYTSDTVAHGGIYSLPPWVAAVGFLFLFFLI